MIITESLESCVDCDDPCFKGCYLNLRCVYSIRQIHKMADMIDFPHHAKAKFRFVQQDCLSLIAHIESLEIQKKKLGS